MAPSEPTITISELARRSGVAPSALRFYETLGLISSERTSGNQRCFSRSMLRRVAVVRVARELGLSLEEIASVLERHPHGQPLTGDDWERLAEAWREQLNARIAGLEHLRDELSSCIGCGCLSLEHCALFNPEDRAAHRGSGPRYLLGDSPATVLQGGAEGHRRSQL